MLSRFIPWLLLVFVGSWGWAGVVVLSGKPTVGIGFLVLALPFIMGPAVGSLVWRRFWTREVALEDLHEVRLNHAAMSGWLGAVALVWVAALVSAALGWGALDLSGVAIAERMRSVQGPEAAATALTAMQASALPYAVVASMQALLVGLLYAVLRVGEEYGWRGVALRELAPLGFWGSAVLTALLWGIWRLPLVVLGGYFPGDEVVGAIASVLASVPIGVLLAVLARWGGSVWAPAIAQGVLTAIGPFQELVTRGGSTVLTSPMGAAGGIAATLLLICALPVVLRSPAFRQSRYAS